MVYGRPAGGTRLLVFPKISPAEFLNKSIMIDEAFQHWILRVVPVSEDLAFIQEAVEVLNGASPWLR